MIDATEAFARRVALDLAADQIHRLAARFLAEWQVHIKPVDGVAAMVGRLRLTHRLGIVSNTHDTAMIPAMLAAMAIDDAFETVVLSVDHGFRKPRASIYEAALAAIDSSPEVALFVGDSHEADYVGPRRLGMRALLIDPDGQHTVDPHDRISTVLDVEGLV